MPKFIVAMIITAGVAIAVALLIVTAASVVGNGNIGNAPEYDRYLEIRDASNCTQTNDTFCKQGGCIHAYEYCQKQQCPQDF